MLWLCITALFASHGVIIQAGILYPRASESREVLTLDGIWKFTVANKSEQDKGFTEKWFSRPLEKVNTDYILQHVSSQCGIF